MTSVAELKQVHHATWAAGDYALIAELVDDGPPAHLIERMGIEEGMDVLDVATGTGNVAVRAAAAGARTTGLDLTPELFDAGRRRAADAGVQVEWTEGDAEALPFAEDSFDRVLSTFGVQFAPRHEVVAHELARVCRPGGMLGLVNWTPESQVGRLFKIMGSYLPPPPEFVSPPPLWGSTEHVEELFRGTGVALEFEEGRVRFSFGSGAEYADYFAAHYGPTLKARERLTAEGRWEDCRSEVIELVESLNVSADGRLEFDSEYLLTIGRAA